MPVFSIIVPFKNAQDTLRETLQSFQNQSFEDWEAIVVDDGSCDRSREIVTAFASRDCRFRMVRNTGTGASDARNLGAEIATGVILSFCDADDLWTPSKLSELHAEFRRADVDGIYGRTGFFQRTPNDCKSQSAVLDRPVTIRDLIGENPVCSVSNLSITRHAFMEVGMFDRDCMHKEDLEFLVRFIGSGHRLSGIDSLHVWCRVSSGKVSGDFTAMIAARAHMLQTAQRYGVLPRAASDAVYMRYLAGRALRMDGSKTTALAFTLTGLKHNAGAFLFPLHRGGATLAAALLAPVLPSRVSDQRLAS